MGIRDRWEDRQQRQTERNQAMFERAVTETGGTLPAPGDAPAARRPRGWDAREFIIAGILTAVAAGILGAAAYDSDEGFGLFVVIVGSTVSSLFLLVGVIAKGVQVGIDSTRD